MAKTKNTTTANPSQDSTQDILKKWILIAFMALILPFYFPTIIIKGDYKKGNFVAQYFIIFGIVMSIIYALIVRKLAKKYPKTSVIKYALVIWAVGIVIALFVRQYQDKQSEDKKLQEMSKATKVA